MKKLLITNSFLITLFLMVVFSSCKETPDIPVDKFISVDEFSDYIMETWEMDEMIRDSENVTESFNAKYPDYYIEFISEKDTNTTLDGVEVDAIKYDFISNYEAAFFPETGFIVFATPDNKMTELRGIRNDTVPVKINNLEEEIKDGTYLILELNIESQSEDLAREINPNYKYTVKLKKRKL